MRCSCRPFTAAAAAAVAPAMLQACNFVARAGNPEPCMLALAACRDLSLADGHCFKNLIVGKTNTLNYYQPMNFTANTTVCGGGGWGVRVHTALSRAEHASWRAQQMGGCPRASPAGIEQVAYLVACARALHRRTLTPAAAQTPCPLKNLQVHIRERVESMAVFKQFVSTAQREFVAAEKRKNPAAAEFRVRGQPRAGCHGLQQPDALSYSPAFCLSPKCPSPSDSCSLMSPWSPPLSTHTNNPPPPNPPIQGYSNPKMEVLRKGIGPEDIDKVGLAGLSALG